MKDKKFNEGVKHIKKVGLLDEERKLLYKNILGYVDNNPVLVKNRSSYGTFWFVNIFNRTSFAIIVIAIITFGGMTVFAAEKSLPGDLLYPIKVNVNEPVVDVVTFGRVSKIAREAEKADERLKEAEALASQGRLNEESRKELEDRFSEHTEKINDFALEEKSKNDKANKVTKEKINSVKINFEKNVSEHTDNLEKIKENLSEGEKEEVETLKNNVLDKVKKEKERSDRKDILEKRENKRNEEIKSRIEYPIATSSVEIMDTDGRVEDRSRGRNED